MEVKVIEPMFHKGEPVKPGEVIDLSPADAAYLVSIKRVEVIEAAAGAGKPKAAARTKAKAKEGDE